MRTRETPSRWRPLALGALATLMPIALLELALAAIDFSYYPPLVVPLWGGRNDVRMLLALFGTVCP